MKKNNFQVQECKNAVIWWVTSATCITFPTLCQPGTTDKQAASVLHQWWWAQRTLQTGVTATVYICDVSSCCYYEKYHTARAVLAKPLQFFFSGNISTSRWRCCNWRFWLSFPSISTIMRGQTHMYTYAFSNHVWSKFDNSAVYWSVCADGKNLSDLHPTKLPLLWLSVCHFAIIHFRSELPHTISGVIM